MDWMSGYSMTGLAKQWVFDPFRFFVSNEFIELYMVHICGLIFDLSEGFLLLFDKTRPIGLFFGAMFHLMNSQMFHIGMFPWTMLATMPFFFRSDWPRRFSRAMPACFAYFLPHRDDPKVNVRFTERFENDNSVAEQRADECEERYFYIKKTFLIGLASFYVIVQLFLPWSHFITQVSFILAVISINISGMGSCFFLQFYIISIYVVQQSGLLFSLGVQCVDKWTLRVFMGYDGTLVEHTACSC